GLASLRAEVQVVEPTGPDTMVFVSLNQTKVCCRLAPDAAPAPGQSLTLQLEPDKVLLFDARTGERLGVSPGNGSAGQGANITRLAARCAGETGQCEKRSEERRVGKECRSRGWPKH